MDIDYSKIKCVNINGDPYWIHDYILKKMSIFEILFDESFDKNDINIVLENYDTSMIKEMFKILYGNFSFELSSEKSVEKTIKLLRLMMYFGIDQEIINIYISQLREYRTTIVIIFDSYLQNKNDDLANMILDSFNGYPRMISSNNIKSLLDRIKGNSLGKNHLVIFEKFIYRSMDIHFKQKYSSMIFDGYSYKYNNYISQIYSAYDIKIDDSLIQIKFNVDDKYYRLTDVQIPDIKEYELSDLIINDKEIEIIKSNKYFDTSDNKFNEEFKLTVSNHIAKILLGFETI